MIKRQVLDNIIENDNIKLQFYKTRRNLVEISGKSLKIETAGPLTPPAAEVCARTECAQSRGFVHAHAPAMPLITPSQKRACEKNKAARGAFY